MRARYVQRVDGEAWTIRSGEVIRLACCGCGLVHDVVLVSEDGKPIGIAVKRNKRATAQKRRNNIRNNRQTEVQRSAGTKLFTFPVDNHC